MIQKGNQADIDPANLKFRKNGKKFRTKKQSWLDGKISSSQLFFFEY